jgi:hypothetical protein
MSVTLPPELLRQVFLYSRSPTAWLIMAEFQRRAQEEADLEAHDDAAERFYSNQEAENERQAYSAWLQDMTDDSDED